MAKRVLIADDEPNIVTSLEFLMTKGGYEVGVARNGEEALAMIEGFMPDLVLLEMMPRRRAAGLPEDARRGDWRHIKIVMPRPGPEGEVSAVDGAGAYGEALLERELVARIRELLGRTRSRSRHEAPPSSRCGWAPSSRHRRPAP